MNLTFLKRQLPADLETVKTGEIGQPHDVQVAGEGERARGEHVCGRSSGSKRLTEL